MRLINVRKRPGMYIGDVDEGAGPQSMIKEALNFLFATMP